MIAREVALIARTDRVSLFIYFGLFIVMVACMEIVKPFHIPARGRGSSISTSPSTRVPSPTPWPSFSSTRRSAWRSGYPVQPILA
jgi:hypothetical protein